MDFSGASSSSSSSSIKEQERLLPIANISRIMKRALPDHAKMSKEAKGAVQECVTEFICFITGDSSDRVSEERRKTIAGDDVIRSMSALGFDSYLTFLDLYLRKYREAQKAGKGEKGKRGRKSNRSKKAKADEQHAAANPRGTMNASMNFRGDYEAEEEEEEEEELDDDDDDIEEDEDRGRSRKTKAPSRKKGRKG